MKSFLTEIISHKKKEILICKKAFPLPDSRHAIPRVPRDFKAAVSKPGLNIIAEIKKASPSKGVINKDFDYLSIAAAYEANGADAVSVLTDEKYFQGSLSIMEDVADAVSLPVLRKDFIIDPYQIYEAAHHGASAVLLIAALLEAPVLKKFVRLCRSLKLSALVEVHTQDELNKALKCGPEIIGINNRDLDTFRTDLRTTLRLLEHVPKEEYIIVSESGVRGRRDALRLKEAGVHAILVGESLMAAKDIGAKLKELKA